MSATAIKPCTCPHAYQDARYGSGRRVHNEGKGKSQDKSWTCTVCGIRKE